MLVTNKEQENRFVLQIRKLLITPAGTKNCVVNTNQYEVDDLPKLLEFGDEVTKLIETKNLKVLNSQYHPYPNVWERD